MQKFSASEAHAPGAGNGPENYTAEYLRVKDLAERGVANAQHSLGFMSVSYTHLTLPTSDLV